MLEIRAHTRSGRSVSFWTPPREIRAKPRRKAEKKARIRCRSRGSWAEDERGLHRLEVSPQRFFSDPTSDTVTNQNPEFQTAGTATTPAALPSTILLVDDDCEVRSALRAALAPRFQILEAENGRYALGVLAEHIPDLIISDVSMPDMDGVSLLREIRNRDLDIPVILVTGEPALDGAVKAVEYGALRYLTKPVEPSLLHELVDQAIGMRQMALAKREMFHLTDGRQGTASDFAGQLTRFERAVDSIYLHFQPIWSVQAGQAVGFECLLRCDEPSLKQPPDLIQAAEELGRTEEIGRAIRQAAVEALASLPASARLFVNLHYADLNDPELFDPNTPFTQASDRIVLEITERESLEAIANAQDKVHQLREFGFEIAMDDLGAGHNGLAAFTQLGPEVVKLDMKLIRNVDREERQCELVRVMHDFCIARGMRVIAEGVETREELEALVAIGVDLFQGYLIARPESKIRIPDDPLGPQPGDEV